MNVSAKVDNAVIIEGIITTENEDGSVHVAPIGPHVNPDLTDWTLKPFKTSSTYRNLVRSNRGVFHVVDNSLLMVRAVLGLASSDSTHDETSVPTAEFHSHLGWVLHDCSRYVALTIREWDTHHDRATALCDIVEERQQRAFWGWNRAAHSLLELSILYSRRHMLPAEVLQQAWEQHRIIIEKTAGPNDLEALSLLERWFVD